MKLAQTPQDVAIQGNFETSDFNLGDVAFIIDMFSDKVYTNKVRAVIRELSCNAHDAHVAANTTEIPFDVHLPTKLEPYFTIRDYGTGLSDAEVRSIFCGIGISTKRDSNDFIGAFGIGSLSPYSLGDSFTVRSYYNGMMRTYNCYRDNLRKPKVALLTEVETNDRVKNGLEISVNVEPEVNYSGNTDWADEAVFVYRHWKGTSFTLNDGAVVEKLQERQYQVKGDFYGLTSSYGTLYAVMGNIAYDMSDIVTGYDWRSLEGYIEGYIEFEMGELDFDTARENLSITEKTKAAVEAKLEKVKECAGADIQAYIESLPTQWDRAVYCERLPNRLRRFLKLSVLDSYKLPTCSTDMVYYNSSGKGTSHRLYLSKGTRYFLDKRGYVARIRAAAKEARETFFVLTQEQADEMMVPAELLEDLETLPKVHRASNTKVTTNAKVFVYQDPQSRWADKEDYWAEEEVDLTGEVVFVELRNWHPESAETWKKSKCKSAGNRNIKNDFLTACRKLGIQEPTIVGLKSAYCRTKAFKDGNFIRLEDWFVREVKKVTPEGFSIPEYTKDNYTKFEHLAEGLNHEEIQEIVDSVVEWDESQGVTLERVYKFMDLTVEKCTKTEDLMNNFLDKYPMVEYIGAYQAMDKNCRQAVASYINATFKEDNNG